MNIKEFYRYFSSYGPVRKSYVMKDPRGGKLYCGFIEFYEPEVMEDVLKQKYHQINSVKAKCYGFKPKFKQGQPDAGYSPQLFKVIDKEVKFLYDEKGKKDRYRDKDNYEDDEDYDGCEEDYGEEEFFYSEEDEYFEEKQHGGRKSSSEEYYIERDSGQGNSNFKMNSRHLRSKKKEEKINVKNRISIPQINQPHQKKAKKVIKLDSIRKEGKKKGYKKLVVNADYSSGELEEYTRKAKETPKIDSKKPKRRKKGKEEQEQVQKPQTKQKKSPNEESTQNKREPVKNAKKAKQNGKKRHSLVLDQSGSAALNSSRRAHEPVLALKKKESWSKGQQAEPQRSVLVKRADLDFGPDKLKLSFDYKDLSGNLHVRRVWRPKSDLSFMIEPEAFRSEDLSQFIDYPIHEEKNLRFNFQSFKFGVIEFLKRNEFSSEKDGNSDVKLQSEGKNGRGLLVGSVERDIELLEEIEGKLVEPGSKQKLEMYRDNIEGELLERISLIEQAQETLKKYLAKLKGCQAILRGEQLDKDYGQQELNAEEDNLEPEMSLPQAVRGRRSTVSLEKRSQPGLRLASTRNAHLEDSQASQSERSGFKTQHQTYDHAAGVNSHYYSNAHEMQQGTSQPLGDSGARPKGPYSHTTQPLLTSEEVFKKKPDPQIDYSPAPPAEPQPTPPKKNRKPLYNFTHPNFFTPRAMQTAQPTKQSSESSELINDPPAVAAGEF